MVLKKPDFLSKSSKLRVVRPYDFVKISLAFSINIFLRNVWRYFRLPMSALVMIAGMSFNVKFTAKIDFSIRYLMLPLLMLTLED